MSFILAGSLIINTNTINYIDILDIENLKIYVHHNGLKTEVQGIQAIEIILLVKPSAFESKRLKWAKHTWAIHNLIGHPIMQLLAFLRLYKQAMFVHDFTVPRPNGMK